MSAQHTPGPWFAVRNSCYWEINTEPRDSAQTIAEFCPSKFAFGEDIERANIEFVVRACNSYDAIVSENARLKDQVWQLQRAIESLQDDVTGGGDGLGWERARAALALAKEGRP